MMLAMSRPFGLGVGGPLPSCAGWPRTIGSSWTAIFMAAILALLLFPTRFANGAVELLELAEDFLGKLDIALMQHREATADALVGAAQPASPASCRLTRVRKPLHSATRR